MSTVTVATGVAVIAVRHWRASCRPANSTGNRGVDQLNAENADYAAAYQVANAKATGSCAGPGPAACCPPGTCGAGAQGCDVDDRAAFRTAAAICVVLCLIWDLATVVLPLQLAAIGLLYWAPRGWSVRRTNRGRRFRKR